MRGKLVSGGNCSGQTTIALQHRRCRSVEITGGSRSRGGMCRRSWRGVCNGLGINPNETYVHDAVCACVSMSSFCPRPCPCLWLIVGIESDARAGVSANTCTRTFVKRQLFFLERVARTVTRRGVPVVRVAAWSQRTEHRFRQQMFWTSCEQ